MKNVLGNVPEERYSGTFFIKRIFFRNVIDENVLRNVPEECSPGVFFIKRMFFSNVINEECS